MIITPSSDLLPITDVFHQHLGTILRTIVLKTNIGCIWMIWLGDVNGRVAMDQGWEGFVIAHEIKIG